MHKASGEYPYMDQRYFSGWSYDPNPTSYDLRPGDTFEVCADTGSKGEYCTMLFAYYINHADVISGSPALIYDPDDFTDSAYQLKSVKQTVTWREQRGSLSDWSEWTTNSISASHTTEVETNVFYRYYYFLCNKCGDHNPLSGNCSCGGSSNEWHETWLPIPYSGSSSSVVSYASYKRQTTSLGDGQLWYFSAGNLDDTAPGTIDSNGTGEVIHTVYRSRTYTITTSQKRETVTAYTAVANHVHRISYIAAQAAACATAGNIEYWHCSDCGKYYLDADCAVETSADAVILPATGHSYSNGSCTRCGAADPEAAPSDSPRFVVSQATGYAGNTVTVTVSAENNPGIVAAYLDISYDRSKLKLTAVANGAVMSDSNFSTTYDISPYCLNWDESANPGNNTNNGIMATMTFQILDGCADGSIPITLTYDPGNVYNTDMDNVTFAIQNGEVQVVSYLPGDVNDDHVINGKDVTLLRRYVGKWPNTTIHTAAADVAVDGVINGKDVTLLRRYVGKWPGIVLGSQTHAASMYGMYALMPQSTSGTPTFSVSNEVGKSGESVTVTVSVADNPGIIAAYLDISYDINSLTLTNVTNGTVMSDSNFSTTLNVSPYCLNWDESSKSGNNTNNGVLATMTFMISESCPNGVLPITLSYETGNVYDTDLNDVAFTVENGSITVSNGSSCEHVFTNKPSNQKATNATCTEAATYYVQCDLCEVISDTVTVAVGNALDHDWSNWTVTTEATCTEKGEKTRSCRREGCNAAQNEEIPALQHDFTVAQHDETAHWKKCSRCGSTVERAAHSFAAHDCDVAANCTGCGYVKPAGQHSYGAYVQTKAPTCTEAGEEYRSCSACGHIEPHVISALGHTPGTPVQENVIPAAKGQDGSFEEVIYCTACGKELSRIKKTLSNRDNDYIGALLGILGSEPAFPFRDVPASSWYYGAVRSAWQNKLINGVTATSFCPDANMTVAQAIKLAASLHQMNRRGSVALKNGTPSWYSSYVRYAIGQALIEPAYGDYTDAQMNRAVTRAEFVHIFHGAAADLRELNSVSDNAIPDVRNTDAYAGDIYDFYRAGIVTGSDANGTFLPASTIKRSEAAAILIRMYDASARKSVTLG